ncbi:MAG TPA: hypothetical protein VF721_02015 [Pyrinomonadaceae bacterium]
MHDKATRGEALSETENTQLAAWYEAQDECESDLLNKNAMQDSFAERRNQIQNTLGKFAVVHSKNLKIFAENETLRRENEVLRKKLGEKLSLKIV